MSLQAVSACAAAQAWQRHCQLDPSGQFEPLSGPPAVVRRIAHYEAALIEQLLDEQLDVAERALALRAIVDLRGCSTRAVAGFFQVECTVVVQSLMLMKAGAKHDVLTRALDVHIPSKAA